MDEPITKRIHVAGLTPAISAEDIQKRLSTFGTVKSVDGVGKLDGVGQPRKYGYVTLETTTGKLARCMNVLSGATWKGAKLRLGEAKPDFAERHALQTVAAEAEEPPRKRSRVQGAFSADMSLVTPENVDKRGGWKKTPLGRILKPVRIRPDHPLPPTMEEAVASKKALKKNTNPKGKRIKLKAPPTRARKVTIDVTKWGSTQLKGMFLESQASGVPTGAMDVVEEAESSDEDSASSEAEEEVVTMLSSPPPATTPVVQRTVPIPSIENPTPKKVVQQSTPPTAPVAASGVDLSTEKKQTLDLLSSIFGGNHDWNGRESVGSDIDEEELLKGDRLSNKNNQDDFEVVPRALEAEVAASTHESEEEDDQEEDGDEEEEEEEGTPEPAPPAKGTDLQDLFAPRNEEVGFSLLGHLDLDLELDEEVPFAIDDTSAAPTTYTTATFFQPTPITNTRATTTYLNPRQALFFPLPESIDHLRVRQRDIFDVIKENRWEWCDPGVAFYRTNTEDEIRKDWEEKRADLTRDWKKRAREAGKMSRKRKGGVDGEGDI